MVSSSGKICFSFDLFRFNSNCRVMEIGVHYFCSEHWLYFVDYLLEIIWIIFQVQSIESTSNQNTNSVTWRYCGLLVMCSEPQDRYYFTTCSTTTYGNYSPNHYNVFYSIYMHNNTTSKSQIVYMRAVDNISCLIF